MRLSRAIGCSPEFWLGLEARYDLEETEEDAEELPAASSRELAA